MRGIVNTNWTADVATTITAGVIVISTAASAIMDVNFIVTTTTSTTATTTTDTATTTPLFLHLLVVGIHLNTSCIRQRTVGI